ncbi:MAG: hypothetical protein DI628_00450 [Blastochloris viridis]|uniref:Alpha/beta hydrolase n=1 Tax=Blastochloris viridis TaxID=1079 RepID=A0A6N4R1E7_BLAVI|nr:MAG: hypothetical protein DI628_00450 [Blastochloris viridis]
MNMSTKTPALRTLLLATAFLALHGCSSLAKGITEAVIQGPVSREDLRQCEIEGAKFDGIRQSLSNMTDKMGVTKVLMVHGINSHMPGYSTRFRKKLLEELELNVTEAEVKTIQLDSSEVSWKPEEPHVLGQLKVSRHTDNDGKRQLIFYELTWSPISDLEKKTLMADSANYEGLRRASLNASLKSFMNTTVPDLLIYTGDGRDKITASVKESVCWMLGNDWESLPKAGQYDCNAWRGSTFDGLADDNYFFVTHSLGSRITIDTIQDFSKRENDVVDDPKNHKIGHIVREKNFTVFMLANQLPLLQMGRKIPEVTNEQASYCAVDGAKASQRVMNAMNIIAFSDPNDILSYPIPFDFADKSIDSRICPIVTNVSLQVANTQTLFDAVSFANPLQAHSGYMEDDRVVDLIANGIHADNMSPLIKSKCKWLEISRKSK